MREIQPRSYVVCLAAYNNGFLHGKWIDANQDADAIREEIIEVLSCSPMKRSDEWAIHSYEGFGSLNISDSEDIDNVAELGHFIAEHDTLSIELLSYTHGDIEEAKRLLEECYQGEYDSEENFARTLKRGLEIFQSIWRII